MVNLVASPTADEQKLLNQRPILWGCSNRWSALLQTDDSIITHQMKGLYATVTTCQRCKSERRIWDPFTYVTLVIKDTTSQSLDDAIRSQYGSRVWTTIDDFKCESDTCKNTQQTQRRSTYIAHLPNYLVIQLIRYTNTNQKILTKITFPERGVDLGPAFPTDGTAEPDIKVYPGQIGPFKYDCYAVTQHRGDSPRSGHYWTLAQRSARSISGRGGQDGWVQFNDRMVVPLENGFQATQTNRTSIIFLKRQNVPR